MQHKVPTFSSVLERNMSGPTFWCSSIWWNRWPVVPTKNKMADKTAAPSQGTAHTVDLHQRHNCRKTEFAFRWALHRNPTPCTVQVPISMMFSNGPVCNMGLHLVTLSKMIVMLSLKMYTTQTWDLFCWGKTYHHSNGTGTTRADQQNGHSIALLQMACICTLPPVPPRSWSRVLQGDT